MRERSTQGRALVPSFDDAVRYAFANMPRSAAQLFLTAWAVLSWFAAPINFLAQVSELQLVLDFWSGLLRRLQNLRPLLDTVVDLLRPAIEAWREATLPLLQWASSLLQLQLPLLALHLALMLLLSVPALLRFGWAHSDIVFRTAALRSALRSKLDQKKLNAPREKEGAAIINGLLPDAGASQRDLRELENELKRGALRRMGVRYEGKLMGREDTIRDLCHKLRASFLRRANSVAFLLFAGAFTALGTALVIADNLIK